MRPSVPRLARKIAFVCLVVVGLLASFLAGRASASPLAPARAGASIEGDRTALALHARAKYSATPLALRTDDGGSVLAFPPRDPSRTRRVVFLHGIHGRAENGCPWLRSGASEIGWLVCPEANERLSNGTFSWNGSAADKQAIIARAERAAGAEETPSPDVLVGFSQGAFVALELVHARLGRHAGLVLMSAEIAPDARELRAAGVTRVAFAAGELDGSYASLRSAAARLASEGVATRFTSLGKVGHVYVPETAEHAAALRDAIVWAGNG